MSDTNRSELPAGLRSGRVEGISVPDLLWALCRPRKTGVLHVTRDDVRNAVYVQDGQIVFAASSDPDHRLGELLLRDGLVSLEQLEEGLSRLSSGKRLGTLLVEAGYLSPDNLVRGVLNQVQRIVLDLFTWQSGEYRFEEGPLPTREVITLNMRTGELLLQGIRRIRSFGRIRRSVGAPRTFYATCPDWEESLQGLSLADGELTLVRRLEQGETVEQLCREVFLSNFEIYQTLWAMKVLGVIEERDRPFRAEGEALAEGSLEAGGIGPVLVRLCRAGETGVLYVVRGSSERTMHIREGQCVFATSNDFEDGLLAYLLRRGVISLRDREETAKRLLSNKRVGTILRELGVIDDEDLRVMVREQLCEIIFDTFTWEDGEYTFVSGELPTIEEITLDVSIEALVAGGLRRVASWSRVRRGCGGLTGLAKLSPNYLDVLDRMEVSTEEWEVVSRLRKPQTILELCAQTHLGDFVACQTLWILRTLGAVEVLEADSVEARELERLHSGDAEAQAGAAAAADAPDVDDEEIPAAAAVDEAPGDATTYIPREAIEAALRGHEAAERPAAPAEAAPPQAVEAASRPDGEAAFGPKVEAAPEIYAEHERETVAAEIDELDDTSDIPRRDVQAALGAGGGNGDPSRADEDDGWEPPSGLEEQIARFNAQQRLLYRTIRAEVGAGAANFVRSCTIRIVPDCEDPFPGAELQSDGTWDVEGLRRAVRSRRLEDPSPEYDRLIELEIEMLRDHIGDSRARSLRQQITDLGEAHAQTAVPPE